MNKEQMTDFIESLKINEITSIPILFDYKTMQITNELEGYSWKMEYNFDFLNRKRIGFSFPTIGNYVQFFKTEKGAKRSLLKFCKRVLERNKN